MTSFRVDATSLSQLRATLDQLAESLGGIRTSVKGFNPETLGGGLLPIQIETFNDYWEKSIGVVAGEISGLSGGLQQAIHAYEANEHDIRHKAAASSGGSETITIGPGGEKTVIHEGPGREKVIIDPSGGGNGGGGHHGGGSQGSTTPTGGAGLGGTPGSSSGGGHSSSSNPGKGKHDNPRGPAAGAGLGTGTTTIDIDADNDTDGDDGAA